MLFFGLQKSLNHQTYHIYVWMREIKFDLNYIIIPYSARTISFTIYIYRYIHKHETRELVHITYPQFIRVSIRCRIHLNSCLGEQPLTQVEWIEHQLDDRLMDWQVTLVTRPIQKLPGSSSLSASPTVDFSLSLYHQPAVRQVRSAINNQNRYDGNRTFGLRGGRREKMMCKDIFPQSLLPPVWT